MESIWIDSVVPVDGYVQIIEGCAPMNQEVGYSRMRPFTIHDFNARHWNEEIPKGK